MIKEWIRMGIAYLEWGIGIMFDHLMTIEGIVALLIGLFVLGLIARLRG